MGKAVKQQTWPSEESKIAVRENVCCQAGKCSMRTETRPVTYAIHPNMRAIPHLGSVMANVAMSLQHGALPSTYTRSQIEPSASS